MKYALVQGLLANCMRKTQNLLANKVELTKSTESLFAMGRDVDAVAEATILQDARTVEAKGSAEEDANETSRLIESGNFNLNQATFSISNGRYLRVDSINLTDKELKEVKGGSSKKSAYVLDIAIQEYLLRKSGRKNIKFTLIVRNAAYFTGHPWGNALKQIDVTKDVETVLNEEGFTAFVENVLKDPTELANPVFSKSCKNCEFVEGCWPDLEFPSFNIPRISDKTMAKIIENETFDLASVPDDLLSPTQLAYKRTILDVTVSISLDQLVRDLSNITFPVAHLDFEAVNLPFHPAANIRTCDQVPFQSSIHVEFENGDVEHFEYLCAHAYDDRYALAQHLIDNLAEVSTILTWNVSFEKRMLKHLAEAFPQLAIELQVIIEKLVDLEPIVKNNIQHFAFAGRYSLKYVAPALSDNFSYNDLEIDNGNEASGAFSLLIRGLIPEDEITHVRQDLLEYCKNDTLATLEVHRFLRHSIKGVKK